MNRKINIRNARPGEGKRIAELILMAWPVEDFLAGNPDLTYDILRDMIAGAVEAPATIYSFENTMVAEVESDASETLIVGAMCAYDGADYIEFKRPILDVIGHDSDFAGVIETEAGEYYVDSIGVDPEYRGNGIATMLIEAQIKRAWSCGHTRVGLIVDIAKPRAEALYRRLGFEFIGYRKFFDHDMKHMVRMISEDPAIH